MDEKCVFAGIDKDVVIIKLSSGRIIVIGKAIDGYGVLQNSESCVVYSTPSGYPKKRTADTHWDIEETF